MNYKAAETRIWRFPENIGYENVPGYLAILKSSCFHKDLVLDLSETDNFHSSLRFSFYAKQIIEKKRKARIILSKRSERIFHMLNIYNFFSRNITEKLS